MSRIRPLVAVLTLSGCSAPALANFSVGGPDHEHSTSSSSGSETSSGVESSTHGSSTSSGGEAGSESESSSASETSTTDGPDTETGTSAGTGTSSGTDAPSCGDGVVAGDEECDDGNVDDDDACNATCKRERIVFVTSMMFAPDAIGGLALADGLCRQLAQKAGLKNFASFSAWLSDSKTDAIDRVFHGEGRYVRPDGVVVATSLAALLAGPLLAPIEIDEHGELATGSAWTGTRPDGTRVPGTTFCEDWTVTDLFDKSAWYGILPATDVEWTLETDPELVPSRCVGQFHLYCFEGP